MRLESILGGALALLAALLLPLRLLASELQGVEVFPLGDLKPGLKGTGLTVIRGTKIQSFDVEILELVPKGGFDGKEMVLARFSGPVVEQSNGIAGGYSGSPVYIGGKLLGAVSMAIPFTDTHIGGITPIGSMLAALPDGEEPDYSNNTVLPETSKSGIAIDEQGNVISYFSDPTEALAYNERMRAAGLHRYAAVRTAAPVYCSGVSPQVLTRFKPELSRILGDNFSIMEHPAGTAAVPPGLLATDTSETGASPAGLLLLDSQPAPLKPGDAIAVSLMQGDIEMSAIGTVTYSDDAGRFLCFGHPMLAMGDTNMPIGKGYITWTHKSIERAFKDGVRLNSLGSLTQDRSAACGGRFDKPADLVPVKVKIRDIDLGTSKTMSFQVLRHPDFTPILVAMGMAQAATQVLDRQPGGTLKLSYMIEGAGLKEPLRRTNYYSDDTDVIFASALEVLPITSLLHTNIYREVKVSSIEVMLEITRNRVNASIDDASIVWDKKDAAGSDEQAASAAGTPADSSEESASGRGEPPAMAPVSGAGLQAGSAEAYRRYWHAQRRLSAVNLLHTTAERILSAQVPPEPPPQDAPGQQSSAPPVLNPMMTPMPSADLPTFAPGEEIRVRVRLQPYRTDPVWREFRIKVPDDFPGGSTTILVHGGGDLISPSELTGKGRSLFGMGPIIDVKEHDLDSVLNQIMDWPLNNELLVTLVRPYDPAAPQELGVQGEAEKPDQKVDEKYQMEWVIYNGFMLPVNIVSKDKQGDQSQAQSGANQSQPGNSTEPSAQDSADASGGSDSEGELPYETMSALWSLFLPAPSADRSSLTGDM